jgi:hypothetical protein
MKKMKCGLETGGSVTIHWSLQSSLFKVKEISVGIGPERKRLLLLETNWFYVCKINLVFINLIH